MQPIKEQQKSIFEKLKEQFGYTNTLAAPRITKVVISTGVGSIKDEKKKRELIPDRLAKITGQKAAPRGAKKSIATFKLREGDTIGYAVTLRGARMYGFLDKLFNVAIPRTRDFKGIDTKAVDELGNFTIGVKEHTIFPETSDEDLKDVFGLGITIVTTAKTREEALAFFRLLGVPFKKEQKTEE